MKKKKTLEDKIQVLCNNQKRCKKYNENSRRRKKDGEEYISDVYNGWEFSKLIINTKAQMQEAQRTPSWINHKEVHLSPFNGRN